MGKPDAPIPDSPHAHTGNRPNVDNSHLQHLVDERAKAVAARTEADNKVQALNAQIMQTMEAAGARRHQLIGSGAIVTIIEQKPRQVIVASKLLGMGVKPEVIKAATDETPVKPFPRVDMPRSNGQPSAEPEATATDPAVIQ
jgi:hypothetical protein